ncbi:hypothetical protein QBC47DRAFT_312263 [Echria macrotheca]|uniref:Uncharacterized protein n=1 Tax=Echria macrotheca TaxID=438768 RepID=A0AAJ0BNH2_9PEZI|nr:hypothetical protein QBC47DRAFT_312263 [Echria macrotheca]
MDYQCQSQFATDYYGLGVRLGIYFAWLGSYIANTMLPSEFTGAVDTATIFLLTLLIAMTNDSRTGTLSQIDGLTLMHMCGGTVFGVLSIWGYRTRLYSDEGPRAVRLFGGFGTHLRVAVSFAVSVFGMWFWLHGVTADGLTTLGGPDDPSDPKNPPECEVVYTFFFAKIRADSGIRYYYTVVCASCCLWFGTMFIVSCVAGLASFERFKSLFEFYHWGSRNRARYATGFNKKELRYMFLFLRVGNLVWLLFSAVTVEVTLNFNHVHGVLGGKHDGGLQLPSQLLPFTVGLFSFLRIIYFLLKEKFGAKENGVTSTPKLPAQEIEHPVDAAVVVKKDDNWYQAAGAEEGAVPEQGFPRADSYQIVARSLFVRYMVGWLPWLGLVVHPGIRARSRLSGIVERSAGLTVVSPALGVDPAYHGAQQEWQRTVYTGQPSVQSPTGSQHKTEG